MANYRPDYIVDFLGLQLVEDSVGAGEHIIKLLATILLVVDLGVTDHDVGVASE